MRKLRVEGFDWWNPIIATKKPVNDRLLTIYRIQYESILQGQNQDLEDDKDPLRINNNPQPGWETG